MATAADSAIAYALKQVGKPYVWASAGPDGFDCSGLVYAAYKQAGVHLGRTTYSQINDGTSVKGGLAAALPGDLIFPDAGHVQLYIGNGEIVEAPQAGETVTRRKEWAKEPFYGIRRVAAPGQLSVSPISAVASGVSDTLSSVDSFTGMLSNTTMWRNIAVSAAGVLFLFIGIYIMARGSAVSKLAVELTGKAIQQ